MRVSLVLCAIVLMRAVDRAECNLGDFFNNLPTEISNAFSNAWTTIIKAIRRPVRIKRLGSGGKLKTSSTATTEVMKELKKQKCTTQKYEIVHPSLRKLMLPVITTPKWRNLDEWKEQQKASFVGLRTVWTSTIPDGENNEIAGDQRASKLNDENDFGVLMFI